MGTNKALKMTANTLLAIGGVNWGLVGLGGFLGKNLDVLDMVLGSVPWLKNTVFVLVGASAVYAIVKFIGK